VGKGGLNIFLRHFTRPILPEKKRVFALLQLEGSRKGKKMNILESWKGGGERNYKRKKENTYCTQGGLTDALTPKKKKTTVSRTREERTGIVRLAYQEKESDGPFNLLEGRGERARPA